MDPRPPPTAISRYFCTEVLLSAQRMSACAGKSGRDMTPQQASLSGVIICRRQPPQGRRPVAGDPGKEGQRLRVNSITTIRDITAKNERAAAENALRRGNDFQPERLWAVVLQPGIRVAQGVVVGVAGHGAEIGPDGCE